MIKIVAIISVAISVVSAAVTKLVEILGLTSDEVQNIVISDREKNNE